MASTFEDKCRILTNKFWGYIFSFYRLKKLFFLIITKDLQIAGFCILFITKYHISSSLNLPRRNSRSGLCRCETIDR